MKLPRHFVAHADADPTAATGAPRHAVDAFRLGGPHLAEREWCIFVDDDNGLGAVPDDRWQSLAADVRTELSHAELTRGGRPRRVTASEIYLFDLQLLEQPLQTPGVNDPVYLYGTLYGPLPGDRGVRGQLTVTRADVLAGIVHGVEHAFRYGAARCFHLVLPGERAEDLLRGCGPIVAYPLMPAELALADASNEAVVAQLAYDLLSALQADVRKEGAASPLASMTLPVPSRYAFEQALELQGYEIDGEVARKRANGGVIGSLFGRLLGDRVELPPEADVPGYAELIREVLATVPGWPDARARALATCLAGNVAPAPLRPAATPAPRPAPARPAAPPRPAPPPSRAQDWMQDFLQSHPGPTRLTSARRRPAWMEDFAAPSSSSRPVEAQASRPDWMKDFE